jgi:hypothetical protein
MFKRFFFIATALLLNANAFAQNFDGVWRSRGYGNIIAIGNNEARRYQMTAVSLIPEVAGTVKGDSLFADEFPVGTLSRSGDNLIFTQLDDNVYKYDLIDSLPGITQPTADPEFNFEVFWRAFEENCRLFALTNVDWKATYNQYRPRVTATTTNAELFGIFSEVVTPLKDGHTFIWDGGAAFFSPGPIPASAWMLERLGDFSFVWIANYLDNGLLKTAANERFLYGTINQSVGYLNILSYTGYSGRDVLEIPDFKLEEAISPKIWIQF